MTAKFLFLLFAVYLKSENLDAKKWDIRLLPPDLVGGQDDYIECEEVLGNEGNCIAYVKTELKCHSTAEVKVHKVEGDVSSVVTNSQKTELSQLNDTFKEFAKSHHKTSNLSLNCPMGGGAFSFVGELVPENILPKDLEFGHYVIETFLKDPSGPEVSLKMPMELMNPEDRKK